MVYYVQEKYYIILNYVKVLPSKYLYIYIYITIISWALISHRHVIPKAKIACEFLPILILLLLMIMCYVCNHTVLHMVYLPFTALFYLYLTIRVSGRGITDRAIHNTISGWIKLHCIDIIVLTHIFVANDLLAHIGDICVRVL